MNNSVIFNDPIIIVGFLIALLFCCLGLFKKTHFIVILLSILFFVATMAYALLKGAELYEVGSVAIVFLIISLLSIQKNGGK